MEQCGKGRKSAPGDTKIFFDYFNGVDSVCKELNAKARKYKMPLKFASRGGRMPHFKFAPPQNDTK